MFLSIGRSSQRDTMLPISPYTLLIPDSMEHDTDRVLMAMTPRRNGIAFRVSNGLEKKSDLDALDSPLGYKIAYRMFYA